MPEAFLISAAPVPQPNGAENDPAAPFEQSFQQVLRLAGLAQKRLDAVYWAGDPSLRTSLVERGWKPVIGVEAGELSGQMAVHLAAQAVLAGDVDVALAGDPAGVLLVASARTVGSLNLLPRAALVGRGLSVSPSEDTTAAAQAAARRALLGTEEDLAGIKRFSFAVPSKDLKASWVEAFQVKPRHLLNVKKNTTGITALVNLVEALEKNKVRLGLLVSAASDGTVAASLIERV